MTWRSIYNMVNPAADDIGVATATADYILQDRWTRWLYIFHDVRRNARDGVGPGFGHPCPVPYDWHRRNIVGISTDDRNRAHAWIVAVMLKGYAVFYSDEKWGGSSPGSIMDVRERVKRTAIR